MAEIHFALDQRLFDQSGGRLFPGGGTQIELFAIQESGDANFVVDLGLGDHLVADCDDDPIDDLRGREECKGDEEYEEDEESRYRSTTVSGVRSDRPSERLPQREMELEDINALHGLRN